MILEIIGWAGSIMVVTAYGLNSHQKLKSDDLLFYILNIAGGIFLIIYSFYKMAYANIFINIVWVIIALPALIKVITRKKNST